MKEDAVVVFDSGVGGLTVLKELKKRQIKERFLYLADSKNAPYGNKTKEEVIMHVLDSFKQLNTFVNFKAIIIACNTASIYTKVLLEYLYRVPVYSVIDAATVFLNSLENRVTVDVLATNLTVASHAYRKRVPNMYIREISCPSFVPFIENSSYNNVSKRKDIVQRELIGCSTDKAHLVVLGCTHYPLLLNEIQEHYGSNCVIINPSELLADEIANHFKQKTVDFKSYFYLTAQNEYFEKIATSVLKQPIEVLYLDQDFHFKKSGTED